MWNFSIKTQFRENSVLFLIPRRHHQPPSAVPCSQCSSSIISRNIIFYQVWDRFFGMNQYVNPGQKKTGDIIFKKLICCHRKQREETHHVIQGQLFHCLVRREILFGSSGQNDHSNDSYFQLTSNQAADRIFSVLSSITTPIRKTWLEFSKKVLVRIPKVVCNGGGLGCWTFVSIYKPISIICYELEPNISGQYSWRGVDGINF